MFDFFQIRCKEHSKQTIQLLNKIFRQAQSNNFDLIIRGARYEITELTYRDRGCCEFLNLLTENSALKSLEFNDISVEDKLFSNMITALSFNTTLKELNFIKTKLGPEAAGTLVSLLEKSQDINSLRPYLCDEVIDNMDALFGALNKTGKNFSCFIVTDAGTVTPLRKEIHLQFWTKMVEKFLLTQDTS